MGLEGIVSKRKESLYCSGRSSDWLKMKEPGLRGGAARGGGGLGGGEARVKTPLPRYGIAGADQLRGKSTTARRDALWPASKYRKIAP